MATRRLIVEVVGDASSLERTFKRARTETTKFGRATSVATGQVAGLRGSYLGTTAAVLAFGAAVRASFSELFESQRVAAQTEAALRSTGYAARVSADEIDQLAQSLMATSGIDDEVIRGGENMLLTFTRIRNEIGAGNDIFTQATKAALDMSVALGTDMSSAALRLGKALNDPVRGITALRRVGVQFTDAQQAQIAALVKSGDVLEAQKIILRELNTEFGGSAQAFGETLPGQLSKARESFLNLGATIAEIVSPALIEVTDSLNSFLEGLQKLNSPRDFGGKLIDFFKVPKEGSLLGIALSRWRHEGHEAGEGFAEGFAQAVAESPRMEAAATRAATAFSQAARKAVRQPGTQTPFLDYQRALAVNARSLRQQLAVIRQTIDVLRGRLGRATTLKARTALQEEINGLQEQAFGIVRSLRLARESAAQARRDAAEARADRQREEAHEEAVRRARAQARAAAAAETRQFGLLGLGPGGAEIIPNARSLKERFDRLRREIRGTVQDTAENRRLFSGISRVFLEGLKNVRPAVRSAIDDILDTIEDALDERAPKLEHKWKRMSLDAFIASMGLNLTPAEFARLRAGLLRSGPDRTAPPGSQPAFALAGGGTNIQTVNVYGVTNMREFENELEKRKRSRPQVRRGAR